jgi:cyclopropane fatty-acyl-phospholipid synthase-like methyltransferase
MSNIKQVIELHDIGSCQLEFQTTVSVDEFWKLAKEANRVFLFRMHTWDSETGKATISLIPSRGVAYVEKGKE